MSMSNHLTLIGNLVKDPQKVGAEENGCMLRVAVDYKTKSGKNKPNFFNVFVWNSLADLCMKYLKKGRQVLVEARLENRQHDQNGETVYSNQIIATDVIFLGTSNKNTDETNEE